LRFDTFICQNCLYISASTKSSASSGLINYLKFLDRDPIIKLLRYILIDSSESINYLAANGSCVVLTCVGCSSIIM